MRQTEFLATLKEEIPSIRILDEEVVVWGELSPGCQACQNGTWDCTFVTMGCNLACPFCCSPLAIPDTHYGSAFGREPEEILHNQARTNISGISFSGGEVFTQRERLFNWIEMFRGARPDVYLWLYTNGVLMTEGDLAHLAQLGLDEVRFNLAATGYTQPRILQMVRQAARQLPAVTVEIPAIPQDQEKLLAALPVWAACGVRYLNVHELMHEPGTLAEHLPGPSEIFTMPDGHQAHLNGDSRHLIHTILCHVYENGLPLHVNACLIQTKVRQIRGRRRSLAAITQQPDELFDGTFFDTVRVFDGERWRFVHPDAVTKQTAPDWQKQRLRRLAPLSLAEHELWMQERETLCL